MSRRTTQRMVIRTPEGVEFGLILAGPVSRFLAWLVDSACLAFAAFVLSALVSALMPSRATSWPGCSP